MSPILPVVFHTGSGRWQTHRVLADLIGGPEELKVFAPEWRPLFWDLAEKSPEELLEAAGEWLKALAVVRAERNEAETFQSVFAEVLRRLEGLSESERVRWHDLLHFVLSWALRRRPGREREALWEAAAKSQSDVRRGEEIRRMSETIEQTWEEEVFVRGEVRARQEDLTALLEERFGPLPEPLVRQITTTTDLDRLSAAFRRAIRIASLPEFEL